MNASLGKRDPTKQGKSMRGRSGASRRMNDEIFARGKGRRGWGAYDSDGRLLATQTNKQALIDWYGGTCRIERLKT